MPDDSLINMDNETHVDNEDHDPGPYFDDLVVGQTLQPAPAVTIGPGEAAIYQAICGDPLATSLSHPLAEAVTGRPGALVNPALVLHVSIGQSTVATRRVIANLFYRDVVLHQPVRHGETLHTTVEVRGLSELRRRDDRPARGLALLGIHTVRVDDGATVADYERCAMLRFRDATTMTGHEDALGAVALDIRLDDWMDRIPSGWDPTPLSPVAVEGWRAGVRRSDRLRDTVAWPRNSPASPRTRPPYTGIRRWGLRAGDSYTGATPSVWPRPPSPGCCRTRPPCSAGRPATTWPRYSRVTCWPATTRCSTRSPPPAVGSGP